jgi:hypothetical protein
MTQHHIAVQSGYEDATGVRTPDPLAFAQQALARAIQPASSDAEGQLLEMAELLKRQRAAELAPNITDSECDDRVAESGATVDAMILVPARTLPALKAKAEALVWCWGDEEAMRREAERRNLTTAERATYALVSDILATPANDHPGAQPDRTDQDGSLLAAASEFLAARQAYDAAWSRWKEAHVAAKRLHPERPAITRCLPEIVGQDHPALKDPKRRAAFELWTAQCAAIDAAYNVPELAEVVDRTLEAEDAASDRVVAAEPRTMREAVAKYAVLLAAYLHPSGEEIAAAHPFVTFLTDLERLAAR